MQKAEQDLEDIYCYISNTLLEPEIAKKIYLTIYDRIQSLKNMLKRNPIVTEEPFKSIGLRKQHAANYMILYIVNDENNTINIIRILYSKRNWQNLLS